MQKKKILIVEDDLELARLVAFHLDMAGYLALTAGDGLEALAVAEQSVPSLIILDIMLPKIDGWEVCRRVRQNPRTAGIPIIILSALSEVNDRLKGFNLGSDDYVTKPFSPRELMVRIKRVLARAETKPCLSGVLSAGGMELDWEGSFVKRHDRRISLTEKERDLLKLLMNNPGTVLSHSRILDEVWGPDNIVEYGNIDVHIRHLREKLENNPDNPQLIKTVKGEGYRFEA